MNNKNWLTEKLNRLSEHTHTKAYYEDDYDDPCDGVSGDCNREANDAWGTPSVIKRRKEDCIDAAMRSEKHGCGSNNPCAHQNSICDCEKDYERDLCERKKEIERCKAARGCEHDEEELAKDCNQEADGGAECRKVDDACSDDPRKKCRIARNQINKCEKQETKEAGEKFRNCMDGANAGSHNTRDCRKCACAQAYVQDIKKVQTDKCGRTGQQGCWPPYRPGQQQSETDECMACMNEPCPGQTGSGWMKHCDSAGDWKCDNNGCFSKCNPPGSDPPGWSGARSACKRCQDQGGGTGGGERPDHVRPDRPDKPPRRPRISSAVERLVKSLKAQSPSPKPKEKCRCDMDFDSLTQAQEDWFDNCNCERCTIQYYAFEECPDGDCNGKSCSYKVKCMPGGGFMPGTISGTCKKIVYPKPKG